MVSNSNIIKIASSYKKFVEKNKKTPSEISIDGTKYTYKQCAYLFSKFIISPSKAVSLVTVKAAEKPSGDSISENVLKDDYKDMAKRLNNYIEKNNKLPNYVTTKKSKKRVRVRLFIYAFAKIVVYYGSKKQLPNYVTINSSTFSKTSTTTNSNKKYGHAKSKGCDAMGQNTGYYCGCHSLQEVFRNLTGKVVPQSTIARWAGTTTSGTDHNGLNTAVVMFNKTYGFNLSVSWKNLSDVGWSGVKKIIESSNQDIVFHNFYRDQWGHYEVVNKVYSDYCDVQNSLGDQGCSSCYCGYEEERYLSTFQRYISGISQKSLMIITRG